MLADSIMPRTRSTAGNIGRQMPRHRAKEDPILQATNGVSGVFDPDMQIFEEVLRQMTKVYGERIRFASVEVVSSAQPGGGRVLPHVPNGDALEKIGHMPASAKPVNRMALTPSVSLL